MRDQGLEVKVVCETNEAIQEALSFSLGIVIANLDLPGLNGKDLMATFASQSPYIPFIMVASQRQGEDIILAFRTGVTDYIGAPIREVVRENISICGLLKGLFN